MSSLKSSRNTKLLLYVVGLCETSVPLIQSQILRDLWTMSSSLCRPESLHCLLRLNAPWLRGTARATRCLYVLQIMLRTTSQFQLSSSPNAPSVLRCTRTAIPHLEVASENNKNKKKASIMGGKKKKARHRL